MPADSGSSRGEVGEPGGNEYRRGEGRTRTCSAARSSSGTPNSLLSFLDLRTSSRRACGESVSRLSDDGGEGEADGVDDWARRGGIDDGEVKGGGESCRGEV